MGTTVSAEVPALVLGSKAHGEAGEVRCRALAPDPARNNAYSAALVAENNGRKTESLDIVRAGDRFAISQAWISDEMPQTKKHRR